MNTHSLNLRRAVLPTLAIGVLALAGCGSNGGSSSSTASGGGQGSGAVVNVSDAGGQKVLVNSAGRALYVSDQEKNQVLCTSGACDAIWSPLTVSDKNDVTTSGPLGKELGTTSRPDGSMQVTFEGRPLYTFSFDHAAGQVNGDGQQDSFDGTNFTWHAATPSGAAAAAKAPSAPSSSSSPYGGGGYNY
jgi:predicted lipoprotein with Yx(FWY)xxD motif